MRPFRFFTTRHSTPRDARAFQGYAFEGNSMSVVTTLSPAVHPNPSATRLMPQLVFGRKAISFGEEPIRRAAFARAVSTLPNQSRQSAAPRSRAFSTCAVIAVGHAARQGRHGGMVEVEQLPADGELAVERTRRKVEAHRPRIFR